MKAIIIKKKFKILIKITILNEPLKLHGMIKATGYLFDKVAYISDCNKISNNVAKKLMNLNFLIIDCLRKINIHHILIMMMLLILHFLSLKKQYANLCRFRLLYSKKEITKKYNTCL